MRQRRVQVCGVVAGVGGRCVEAHGKVMSVSSETQVSL